MKKIKFLRDAKDGLTNKAIVKNQEIDLGKDRNEKAVKNGLAVWVDSKETEKKETSTNVKGETIETK